VTKEANRRVTTETNRRSPERPSKCSLRRPALSRLAITYSYFGRAREVLEQARAMAEALGDTDGVGRACNKTQRKGKCKCVGGSDLWKAVTGLGKVTTCQF